VTENKSDTNSPTARGGDRIDLSEKRGGIVVMPVATAAPMIDTPNVAPAGLPAPKQQASANTSPSASTDS
jgi:hypothetical protein